VGRGAVSEFLRFSPFLEVLNVVSFDFTAETIDPFISALQNFGYSRSSTELCILTLDDYDAGKALVRSTQVGSDHATERALLELDISGTRFENHDDSVSSLISAKRTHDESDIAASPRRPVHTLSVCARGSLVSCLKSSTQISHLKVTCLDRRSYLDKSQPDKLAQAISRLVSLRSA
jgi:hypothetical protein